MFIICVPAELANFGNKSVSLSIH